MLYIKTRHPEKKGTWPRRLSYRLRRAGTKAMVVGTKCPTPGRKVYNMGCGDAVDDPCVDLLNRAASIRLSIEKRQFIKAMYAAGIPCVLSSETGTLVKPTEKRPWYVRTLTRGHSGAGIELITEDSENARVKYANSLITQPLHTVIDQRTCKEFRFHVFKGDVFHVQQKRRMSSERVDQEDMTVPDNRIRNCIRTYGNGWVFANHIADDVPDALLAQANELAVRAMEVVGIDLGCIDISVNTKSGSLMVIETGTSPALGGETTMARYVEVLQEWCNEDD